MIIGMNTKGLLHKGILENKEELIHINGVNDCWFKR